MLKRGKQLSFYRVTSSRGGAVLPLAAAFMCILFAVAALSVDLAFVELVRTELRSATDSAARAAASALVQGQATSQVQSAAINAAALNKVNGKPLRLTAANVSLGQSILQSNGLYQFQTGVQPYQAVQVTASLSSSNANGTVPLFFGPFLGVNAYSPTNTAVAAASACDVCLVLDRSHSMCWDQTGTNWSYPSPYGLDTYGVSNTSTLAASGLPSGVFQQYAPVSGSRWLALQTAVNSFCSIVGNANGGTHVAMVTWASNTPVQTVYSTKQAPFTLPASVGVTADVGLTSNMNLITNAVAAHSANLLLGGTDMYTGIEAGIAVLTGSGARSAASKVMILMTDGDWSSPAGNTNPVNAAQNALTDKITIHCICFLQSANQTTCQQIASLTGGKFYYATDSASLTAVFQQIAGTLPVALTN
jgi:Ca-activated chloride channel homolog